MIVVAFVCLDLRDAKHASRNGFRVIGRAFCSRGLAKPALAIRSWSHSGIEASHSVIFGAGSSPVIRAVMRDSIFALMLVAESLSIRPSRMVFRLPSPSSKTIRRRPPLSLPMDAIGSAFLVGGND